MSVDLPGTIEPVCLYGSRAYRASAYLRDGTYLPCVLFRRTADVVEPAVRGFATCGAGRPSDPAACRGILKSLVAFRNTVDPQHIERIEKSPFALPARLYHKLQAAWQAGNGWLSFAARMDDGQIFWFSTPLSLEFFDMPPGYSGEHIVDVCPHDETPPGPVYRERPYFECFLDSL